MRESKGITLIALVITIIVLLILSAVTIATLTGENGLLTKASNAKEETNKETATEKINLKITSAQIKSYAEKQEMPDLQYLANELEKDTGENGDLAYVATESQKEKATARNLGRIASTKDEISVSAIDIGNSESIFTKLKEYPYEFEINSSLKLASIDGIKIADTAENASINELRELISKLQEQVDKQKQYSITFTTPSTVGDWHKVADYPEELNKSNCFILASYFIGSGGEKLQTPYCRADNGVNVLFKFVEDGIYVYNDHTITANRPVKIILQKEI